MQDYHKIRAWKMAFDLAIEVRRLTEQFPRTGYRSIKDQIIRSAESVGNNIVEGSGAATNAEFARFLDMSMKSASELEHQLDQVHGYRIIGYDDWRHCTREARDIRKMTWGLRKKVLAAPPPPSGPPPSPPSPP